MFLFPHHNLKKGFSFALLAWLCFSTMYMLSKLISSATTPFTILFARNLLPVFFLLPWVLKQPSKRFLLKNYKIVILRSLMGMLNLFLILLAVDKISLTNTSLLNNASPFFIPLLAWVWLKTPINHKIWPAIILGFIGIAFILRPNMGLFQPGAIYALLSGFCFAIMMITMRITVSNENPYSFLFYFFTIGLIVSFPLAIFDWKIEGINTGIALIFIGFFSGLGQIFLYHALKHAKLSQIGPTSYSTVVFAAMYDALFWHHLPTALTYVGILLIFSAGIWIMWNNKDTNYPKKI